MIVASIRKAKLYNLICSIAFQILRWKSLNCIFSMIAVVRILYLDWNIPNSWLKKTQHYKYITYPQFKTLDGDWLTIIKGRIKTGQWEKVPSL